MFLHQRRDFGDLIAATAQAQGIAPLLVEKDYWIMHCLWGLQAQGMQFELKGGTSLSKGFGIIDRFSEDLDLRVSPPASYLPPVASGRSQDKPAQVASRLQFYAWLAAHLSIAGLVSVERDTAFDDAKMRSAGIRLAYPSRLGALSGIKEGILLELGFDTTTPNRAVNISSWAFDAAVQAGVVGTDNRALAVPCYLPGYTLVEKLQTLSTKYRRFAAGDMAPVNFMRHYYDVYCLLGSAEVVAFIGTPQYLAHKAKRFRSGDDPHMAQNAAFTLPDAAVRNLFAKQYQKTQALYYRGQPAFADILARIHAHIDTL